jgi:[acyl-carrier-protein] S-malonyltransferase
MNPIVVLCPGQGAQFVGMGRAWFDASSEARLIFEQADAALGDRLGAPLSKLCFEGPAERLNQTDVSQPAIYVTSIACWRGLLAGWGVAGPESLPHLHAAAGLSLGEYTALHIAGAFTFLDGLELVTLRGRAMQDAAEAQPSGMVALIGADELQAQEVASRAAEGEVLVCANFNAPGQVVLSGHRTAIDRAVKVAGEIGLRSAVLPVAGAFHSPLIAPAAERLAAALARTELHPLRCPVLSNVTAAPHEQGGSGTIADQGRSEGGSVRRLLVEQLTSPVRWAQSCAGLLASGEGAEFHELAPGTTLAGLMRRIDRSAKVHTHDQP